MKTFARNLGRAGAAALATSALALASTIARAQVGDAVGDFIALPEPDMLALLAIGAVALIAARINRRK